MLSVDDCISTVFDRLPVLPLTLADVPAGLRLALEQEGVPVRDRRPGVPEGRFVLFDARRGPCRAKVNGQTLIDVSRAADRQGDPWADLVDVQSRRQLWQAGGLTVTEEVARVDKRTTRARGLAWLRAEIEAAGGIWLRLAPYPFPYRSAFNFRLDHDEHDPDDFDRTLAAIADQAGATSHFVNGSAYEREPEALARLRGLDVGSHAYWHHTYPSEDENARNIARGIDVLRAEGIEPSGFVAPHGRFYPGLLAALERLGVGHSSEFGLAYDELPFFPPGSNVLQVPVHPVCLGIFLDAAAAESLPPQQAVAAACEHFARLVERNYAAGEPILLYGHPDRRVGRYPGFLRAVFEAVGGRAALWRTTMSELAAWWRVRSAVRLQAAIRGEEITICADRLPGDYRLAVELCRGEHVAVIPLDKRRLRLAPASLVYQRRKPVERVTPVRVDRAEGLRGRIKRMIDWEKVTPRGEISLGHWRGWAKWLLRQWRD